MIIATNNTLNNYPQRTTNFKSSSTNNVKKYQSKTKSDTNDKFTFKDKLRVGTTLGLVGGLGVMCLADEIHWWDKGKSIPAKFHFLGIGIGVLLGLLVGALCCIKKTDNKNN